MIFHFLGSYLSQTFQLIPALRRFLICSLFVVFTIKIDFTFYSLLIELTSLLINFSKVA